MENINSIYSNQAGKMDAMTVCCVFVTYANRFHLLSRVVEEVVKQGVNKVVIVDNASIAESAAGIDKLVQNNTSISLHRFEANQGSAKGFKTGLEIASQAGCDFIWILDDDNLPGHGVLTLLRQYWQQEGRGMEKEERLALLCLRKDREEFMRTLRKGTAAAILPPRNSFMGFHINEIFLKLKERLRSSRHPELTVRSEPLRVDAASYGGLFFHKKLLQWNGLPDDSFVLYIDDFDFTYRITKSGGGIWLLPACIVEDIDQSFYLPTSKKLLYHSTLDTPRDAFVYYVVRNSVYFAAGNLVTAKSIFYLNKYLFITFISLIALLRGKFKRLGLIYRAIKDGSEGRMGPNVKYKL
jgi:GT2 family glycosyltransferase